METSDDCDDDFEALFRLQAGCKTDSQYTMNKAAYSTYLLCLLKRMEFFANNDPSVFEEEHLVVGRFLEHFLRVADDNCHEICELVKPRLTRDKSFDELFDGNDSAVSVVGVGIFPTISLFNNCCDVNTLKFHQGHTETILARRPIRAGEEVSDFYGEYYFQNRKLTRKKNLGFPCGCVACHKNWPLLDNLPGFNVEDVEDRYEWAVQRVALESALSHLGVKMIREICLQLAKLVNVKPPHQATVKPELYLSYAVLADEGNISNEFKIFKRGFNKT